MRNRWMALASIVLVFNPVFAPRATANGSTDPAPGVPEQQFQGSQKGIEKPDAEKSIQETLRLLFVGFEKGDEKRVDELARKLGFESLDQAVHADVGTGFPVYRVRLDKLRDYKAGKQPGTAARGLLIPTNSSIYPITVTVKETIQIRSSATVVAAQNKRTRVTQLGSPELVQLLTTFRTEVVKEGKTAKTCQCFVVWIPALSRYLLGDETSGAFMIKVLGDGPGTLKHGEFRLADEVFAELAADAKNKKYDLPRYMPSKKKQAQQEQVQ